MADFGSSFAQGVSTGSEIVVRAQQLKLQKLQQERARLLEPMQMKAMEQQNTLMALKIKQAELEQTHIVGIETAFTEAADLLSKADMANPEVQMQLFDVFKKSPQAMNDPRFENIMRTLEAAQKLDELKNRVRGTTAASGPPNAYKVKDPVTGKDISVLQTGPNSFQIVNDQRGAVKTAGLRAKLQAITKQNPLLVPLEKQAEQIQQAINEYMADEEEESIPTYIPEQGWPPK